MTRQTLTTGQDPRFPEAFALYEQSFPVHERRTRAAQQGRIGAADYHFDLILEGEELQGILLWWQTGSLRYVEHFAIAPQLRGTGVGSRALKAFLQEGDPVLLEIDPPVEEIARRRQGFYERNGFRANPYPHIHPPYRKGFLGHELVVMTSPGAISPEEYRDFARYLDQVVMADCKPPLEETE